MLADWKRPLLGLKIAGGALGVADGLLISIYSSIDKVGMRYVDPLLYLYLFLVVTWLALSAQCSTPIGARRSARKCRSIDGGCC